MKAAPLLWVQEAADLHTMQVQVSLSMSSHAGCTLTPLLLPCSKYQYAALPPSWVNKQKYLFCPESKHVLP